jgi:hypothetical protein
MARHLERNFYRGNGLNQGGALRARWAQPAKPSYTWKEVFGDVEEEGLTSDQICEINSAQFHVSEVDADEFESVYLWFLA